ncbi:MAG: hypothetical protein C4K49_07155 [Candidatus Thorarchaeota archaeon]|nr:MAG: hypothetical protein C4K49_07155 [Candidatus Thorarchaeota archaeon]
MESGEIQDFESETERARLKVRVMHLENGLLILISDSERFRLGLSAVAVPGGSGRPEPSSTGFLSVGEEAVQVRILAETVAKRTGQMCMVVVAVKELSRAFLMDITRTLREHVPK